MPHFPTVNVLHESIDIPLAMHLLSHSNTHIFSSFYVYKFLSSPKKTEHNKKNCFKYDPLHSNRFLILVYVQ